MTSSPARDIPFVPQIGDHECGAACLQMVLAYHGVAATIAELRTAARVNVGGDGASAQALLAAAKTFGVSGRGVAIGIEDLDLLDPATILYWQGNHFVVFERLSGEDVHIVDPAIGRRRLQVDAFRRDFSGVALIFEAPESPHRA